VDLMILVDRSASISARDYDKALSFAREFAGRFTLSEEQAHVAIANFDVDVQLVIELFQGVSLGNIDAAVNTMSCACADTLDFSVRPWEVPRPSAPTCCARRSSISKALDRASDYLTANGRVESCKAVLVISDGRHNTLIDKVTPCNGGACAFDLANAIQGLATDHPGVTVYGVGVGDTDHFKMATIDGGRFKKLTEGGAVDCSPSE
jgi:hypothetical protein